jgi:hypothetical protein
MPNSDNGLEIVIREPGWMSHPQARMCLQHSVDRARNQSRKPDHSPLEASWVPGLFDKKLPKANVDPRCIRCSGKNIRIEGGGAFVRDAWALLRAGARSISSSFFVSFETVAFSKSSLKTRFVEAMMT